MKHTRRSFLQAVGAGLTALAAAQWTRRASAAAAGLPVPRRGFVSVTSAETWEQGLLSGNGTIGAVVLSRPLDETIVFTHERMYLPSGGPTPPPDTACRLFEMRQLIDRGLYQQATLKGFKISGRDDFRYPDAFAPAFDMRIGTTAKGDVRDYMRGVDFQTGVARVHWADDRGTFERGLFVSRANGVAVLQITGPGKGTIDCAIRLAACQPGRIRVALRSGKEQTITLTAPAKIGRIAAVAGKTSIEDSVHDHARRATLPKDQSVTFEIELK